MKAVLNRIATPLTLGLFAISTISGVAIFFNLGQNVFHQMHVWLSLALLLPFALHMWRNWNGVVIYMRRGALVWPLAASLVAALPFAWPALSGARAQRSPEARPQDVMVQASIADLAPVLKTTPDALQSLLTQKGYVVASPQDTLAKIAAASGKPARIVLQDILPPPVAGQGRRGG